MRPYEEYTAEFSKNYQEQQNCMCDDDHNECKRSIRSKSNDKMADLLREIQTSKSDVFLKFYLMILNYFIPI